MKGWGGESGVGEQQAGRRWSKTGGAGGGGYETKLGKGKKGGKGNKGSREGERKRE